MSTQEEPRGGLPWLRQAMSWLERGVIIALVLVLVVAIVLATFDLGSILVRSILGTGTLLFPISELLELFGAVMLILIGIELLETIRAYLKTDVIHVEIVLEVALIAIARKVIILSLEKNSSGTLLGIAALILTVAVAFYLVRHAHEKRASPGP